MLLALAAAPAAMAHTLFSNLYVDGVDQGDAVAMRMKLDPSTATSPLPDVTSNDMACNVNGAKGVSRVAAVQDGATLTFEMRAWPNDASKLKMDRNHKGPCAVYLKKVDSAINDQAHGDGWFKLFDDGYDAGSGQWCTDKLLDNNGLFSVKLPQGLKGGYYLARPEVLALHNANTGDPQFYTGCAQIFLQSTGDLVPESTVSIPGYVTPGEPALSFNLYSEDAKNYQKPGPPVAKLVSGSAAMAGSQDAQMAQTEGKRPAGCICENGNWCGFEVSSYSTEAGCWAAGQECWEQADKCWDSAGPTGNAGCKIWQAKCQGINDACSAGNFQGPPSKGKDLTPRRNTIDVGVILATEGGGVVAAPKTKDVKPKTTAAQVKPSATPVAEAPEKEVEPKPQPQPQPQPQQPSPPKASPKPSSDYTLELPKATPKAGNNNNDDKPEKPAYTPISEAAPAPTAGPACKPGHPCVTVWNTVVKTEVVYVTVGESVKRRSLHHRRH